MTVVAVDDEEISLMCLEAVLDSMDDVDKVLTFSNAEDTIDYFKTGKADAAFLDIQLYLSGTFTYTWFERYGNLCSKF